MKKLLFFIAILVFGFASCIKDTLIACSEDTLITDGVLINGVVWATRNVDTPGTFADNPESTGMFYQWNRRRAWAATGSITDWDYYTDLGTEWTKANDPCPVGWRVPTQAELTSLYNAGNTRAVLNGVNGYLFGVAPHQVFLPVCGFRYIIGAPLHLSMSIYWGSTSDGVPTAAALSMHSTANPVSLSDGYRGNACSVRCVAE
jgi:uncharacterized protein (TIGR02145 family)